MYYVPRTYLVFVPVWHATWLCPNNTSLCDGVIYLSLEAMREMMTNITLYFVYLDLWQFFFFFQSVDCISEWDDYSLGCY